LNVGPFGVLADYNMGIEYTLRFNHSDKASVASVLRRLPMARELSPKGVEFEMRTLESAEGMPDALVSVETTGLYFCDNGGAGPEFLGVVITCLVSNFGKVTVEDRE
jgi:hypothetical protein